MVIVRKSEGVSGARRRGQDPTLQPSTIADPATVHVAFEYRTCEHLLSDRRMSPLPAMQALQRTLTPPLCK
jgi:hypothetical protein